MAAALGDQVQVELEREIHDGATGLKKGEVDEDEQAENAVRYPLEVLYCGVCSFPLEYCEFSDDFEKCKQWMRKNALNMFEQLVEQVGESLEKTSLGDDDLKSKSKVKKTAKKKVRFESTQLVKVGYAVRGKRKTVTVITGLATFGVDLKKASRMFAQHFSCGSSVSGNDEIVVQGDVVDDIIAFIRKKFEQVTRDLIKDIGECKR